LEKTLLTLNDLAEFIDKCVRSLEKERDSSLMYDLASLLGIVGEARNNNIFIES
jgi:hypothetical protein